MGCCFSCFKKDTLLEKNNIKSKQENLKNFGECAICLNNLQINLFALPCGHIFHENCINNWFIVKKICPICNYSIET